MKSAWAAVRIYWLESVTCLLLLLMVVVVSISVVLRYVFNTGLVWSEELVRYAYIWLIFLGSVTAIRQKAHIGLDIFTERLPSHLRRWVYCVGDLLVMCFLLVQTYYGVDLILKTRGMPSAAMRIPMGWFYCVFPLSGILMLAEMTWQLQRHWTIGGTDE
jgi:TRAP-type C4-dicarboxylate transport system permease small subunit